MPENFHQPEWFWDLIGIPYQENGAEFNVNGRELTIVGGIPRSKELLSDAQNQTKEVFGFKWSKRNTFEEGITCYMKSWLKEKYGDIAKLSVFADAHQNPIVLDAGCGASMSGLALFEPVLNRIKYIGADVSTAVDIAAARFHERGLNAAFLQADLMQLPLEKESVDLIFSEGVLHHTDSTSSALSTVTRYLKPGGYILFYVYRKKGPVREFTDDFLRDKLQTMSPEEGWRAIEPLTKLGKALGELNIEIEVPEQIELLDIPAGKINLQRFFYWHVCKAFFRAEMTLDEMNHINYDWFAPRNAHRQTAQEVREWCKNLGLEIERETIEDAGITIVAKKGDNA